MLSPPLELEEDELLSPFESLLDSLFESLLDSLLDSLELSFFASDLPSLLDSVPSPLLSLLLSPLLSLLLGLLSPVPALSVLRLSVIYQPDPLKMIPAGCYDPAHGRAALGTFLKGVVFHGLPFFKVVLVFTFINVNGHRASRIAYR